MEVIYWSPGMTLEAVERQMIKKAYAHFRENRTATAAALGISVRTLYDKLEQYEADDREQEAASERRRQEREEFLSRSRGHSALGSAHGHPAEAGLYMEPTQNAAAQQRVSVPERQEVQGVLPEQPGAGRNRRGRG